MSNRLRQPSRALAAVLSFAFPGLGQAYAGRWRLAMLLGIPIVLLLLTGAVLLIAFGSQLRNQVLSASFLWGLIALDVVLLAWRLVAIAQAGFAANGRMQLPRAVAGAGTAAVVVARPRPRAVLTNGLVVLLMLATIAMHSWAGLVVGRLDAALGDVFSGGGQQGPGGGNRPPLNEPEYAWDGTARINFLLMGVDAGPGRGGSLTDTILVVSVDPVERTAAIISVPRDSGYLPLPNRDVYPDGLYPRKINELATEASLDPERWCPDMATADPEGCGVRTLERTIGLYLGIPIQYYAQVDLEGFAEMIDAVGGLTLCLPGRMVDDTYSGPTWEGRGLVLPAGCSQYDGAHALAYARVRKGYIERTDGTIEYQNDFLRAERQQLVLLELRREFARLDPFFELPAMLDAVGRTVSTDFPRGRAGDLASLLPLITGPDIERVVLGYPDFVDAPTDPDLNYLLIPRRDDIRTEMERLFGAVDLQGWYVGSSAEGPPS